MSEHVAIPNVKSNIALQTARLRTVTEYSGIYANLLAQYILTDVIKHMAVGNKCDDHQLNTMLADTISLQAAQRSV